MRTLLPARKVCLNDSKDLNRNKFPNLDDLPAAPRNPGDENDANVEPRQLGQTKETGQQERVLLTQNFCVGQRDDAALGVAALRRQNVGDFRDELVEVGHSADVVVVVADVVAEVASHIAQNRLENFAGRIRRKY